MTPLSNRPPPPFFKNIVRIFFLCVTTVLNIRKKYLCLAFLFNVFLDFHSFFLFFFVDLFCKLTPGRRQSKMSILSTNVDQKSLETEFSIVICRPTGYKYISKTLFLSIFDPRLSIAKSVFDCRLPGVILSDLSIH